jgi:hypothetical protein
MASSSAALRIDPDTYDLDELAAHQLAANRLDELAPADRAGPARGAAAPPLVATAAPAMAAAPPLAEPDEPEALSWAELCARYPGQWVVLANISPSFTGELAQLRGKLIDHQPTRRATDASVRTARPHHDNVESFWTGDPEAQLPWPSL